MTIDIVDDDIYELTEQFMVYLTTNDSCVEFKQEYTQVEILDDDCEFWSVYIQGCMGVCVCVLSCKSCMHAHLERLRAHLASLHGVLAIHSYITVYIIIISPKWELKT